MNLNLNTGMRFASTQAEEETFHQNDLVRLFPFGLSLNGDNDRPLMLLKDETQEFTLPVSLTPIEAGMTLTQNNPTTLPVTPHRFSQLLMKSLGIQAQQAVFVQIKGAHQYLRIYLQGHPTLNSIKVRADEAMSLCLQLELPIYATRDYIQRSRLMTAELDGIRQGLKKNPRLLRERGSNSLQ